jgi:hypothetical protein
MVLMLIVCSVLAVGFVAALVVAEFVDRRRSITIGSDASRFAAPTRNPKLPWV